jgi:hypothetical protein
MRSSRSVLPAALLATLIPLSAHAQSARNDFWVPNAGVNAVAISNNTIYLGGYFTQVGPPTGSFLGFDTATGAAIQPYPGVVGFVRAIASDGAGGWYVGGEFTSVQGQARDGLAQIDANGHLTSFGSNFTMTGTNVYPAEIDAIVVSGSTVYLGGYFRSVDGQSRSSIAALDAATGAPTSWNPNATYSPSPSSARVSSLLVNGSSIYAGGTFDAIGGQARSHLAELDAAGNATGWNPNVNGDVLALGIRIGGKVPIVVTIYAGGMFTAVGGQARWSLAAIDAGTGIPTANWAPVVNDYVRAIIPIGYTGPVYIGGDFTTINGQTTRNHLAAIDFSSGSAIAGWDPNANGPVSSLALIGGTLYMCGSFTAIGGVSRAGLAAIDFSSGTPTSWDPNPGSNPFTLAAGTNAIFAGGAFSTAGGVPRHGLAALNATTGLPTSWNADVEGTTFPRINSLLVSGGRLLAGGTFTSIHGVPRTGAAALDLDTGMPTAWNPVLASTDDPNVSALAASGNTVYLGGSFTSVGAQSCHDLAAVDGTAGNPTGWHPNVGNIYEPGITALLAAGGKVYAGGRFISVGGLTRHNLAAIDTTTGVATSWAPQPGSGPDYSAVAALAAAGSNIWVGGTFDDCGGRPRENLAAVDVISGLANPWDDFVSQQVAALAVDGPTLYIAGSFDSLAGVPHRSLASVDLTNGTVRPWGLDFEAGDVVAPGSVQALAVSAGQVVAGGTFFGVNGWAHSNLAVLSTGTTAVDPITPVASAPLRAWPNPFRSAVALQFAQAEAAAVDVAIYDVAGRLVRNLHRGSMAAGDARLEWDGRNEAGANVGPGVYLVRARAGDRQMNAKLLRLE